MISQAYLKSILSYDPLTGAWTWRVHVYRSKMYAGDPAGYQDAHHNRLMIDGVLYSTGRLAVLYMTGTLPPDEVDHADRDSYNDRWRNLRPATKSQNRMNRRKPKNNTTGFKWVSWHVGRKMFIASVSRDKKRRHLGYFPTARAAYEVARAYAETTHGPFFTRA